MKAKRQIWMLALAGVVALGACEGKGDSDPLTKDEAKAAITASAVEMKTITVEVKKDKGFMAQAALQDGKLKLPFIMKKGDSGRVGSWGLVPREIGSKMEEEEFFPDLTGLLAVRGFNNYTGTWEWRGGSYERMSNTPADKIIVKFPHPETSTSNNATLTYSDYKASQWGELTSLKCRIEVDGTVVYSVSTAATEEDRQDGYRISEEVDITLGQFSLAMKEEEEESRSGNGEHRRASFGSVEFSRGGEVLYSESGQMIRTESHSGSSYQSLLTFDHTTRLASLEFRLSGEVNFHDIQDGKVPDKLSMELYTTDGAKVGEFKLKSEQQRLVLYFVYTDGTEVPYREALGELAGVLYLPFEHF